MVNKKSPFEHLKNFITINRLKTILAEVSRGNNLVFVVIVNVLLFFVILFFPVKVKVLGDMDFHIETKAISGYLHGSNEYRDISITKAPGPVLFYTIPYYLAGKNAGDETLVYAARIWMALLTTLLLALCYVGLSKKYSFQFANIFCLTTFIIPLHVYYSLGILAEGMAFLSVLMVILGFVNFEKRTGFWAFVLGLVFLILARPNTILSLPIIFLASIYFLKYKGLKSSKRFLLSSIYAGIAVILISASIKLLPNKRQTLDQETYLAYVIHIGRFQFRTEELDWRFWDKNNRSDSKDYQNYISSVKELETEVRNGVDTKEKIYFRWIINDMLTHPFMVVKQFFIRIIFGNTLRINSITNQSYSIFGIKGVYIFNTLMILLNIINYSVILSAIYYLFKLDSWHLFWPLISIILAIWIFNGIVYIEQRYLFPLRPIVNLLGSFGLLHILNRKNETLRT